MADVPEDLVARGVEQAVERDGELAGAEVGAEVAADLADHVDDQLADLLGEVLELAIVEALQVPGPSIRSSSRVGLLVALGSVALCSLMTVGCR